MIPFKKAVSRRFRPAKRSRFKVASVLSIAAYLWAGPNTCFGIVMGWLLGGQFEIVQGVIEVHGRHVAATLRRLWLPAMAITLGHCVLGQTRGGLDATRAHERVHVRQYERWGVFFIPAYLAAWAWLSCLGRDGYRENPFEVQAYRDGA